MPTATVASPASSSSRHTQASAVCARIAFAVEDRVVHTLRVPALGTLQVGSSEENDLVLCDPRLGGTHTLLRNEGGRWWLTLPAGVLGRARLAGHAGTLVEHVATGRARQAGDVVLVPLDLDSAVPWASAVVELWHGRLLVALEQAPAVHAAPLPRVVRRDLRAEIDWRFGGTLSAVMLAFFFLGLAAEAADPLVELSPPESVFAFRPLYEAPEPPAPDMPAEPTLTDEEPVVADATPTPTRDQTRGPSPREHAGPSTASDEGTPRLTREEARDQAALLLGSIGVGPLRDALAGGAAVRDGQELMDAMADGSVATGPTSGLTAREGRDGTGDELGRFSPTAPTLSTTEGDPVTERNVRVRVDRPTPLPGPTSMPMNPVTQAIRARVGAIRRCYERTLGSNPAARGRLVVSFRVEGSGAFSGVTVPENQTGDAQLAECVSGIIGRLRVAAGPDGGAASFRYPFVFEPH
jgi:hypothetical protein